MNIPKFRVYVKATGEIHQIAGIDLYMEVVITCPLTILYGTDKGTTIKTYSFNEIELMQYIGRKDCKGNEIYEGDIVEYDYQKICSNTLNSNTYRRGKVVFDECQFCFIGNNDEWDDPCEIYNIEVIGNVHQNPELLSE